MWRLRALSEERRLIVDRWRLILALGLLVVGCAPMPSPTPTPSALLTSGALATVPSPLPTPTWIASPVPLMPASSAEIHRWPAPNGQWVAVVDRAAGSLVLESVLGHRKEVFGPGSGVLEVRWSGDSSHLAVARRDAAAPPTAAAADIWLVILDAEGPRAPMLLLKPEAGLPYAAAQFFLGQWSPDNGHLLFWSGPLSASIAADGLPLWCLDVQSGKVMALSDVALVNLTYQSWAPQGQAVVFTNGGYRSALVGKWLARYDVQNGNVSILVPPEEIVPGQVAWSPTGEWIAFAGVPVDQTGEIYADYMGWDNPAIQARRLYLLDVASGEYRRLNGDEVFQDAPRWSPDSRSLYYIQIEGEQAQVMQAAIPGGEAQSVAGCQAPRPPSAGYYGQVEWDAVFEACSVLK